MEFLIKNETPAMTSKMHLALFSLAKTFLQSYQSIWDISKIEIGTIRTFLGMNLLSIKVPI